MNRKYSILGPCLGAIILILMLAVGIGLDTALAPPVAAQSNGPTLTIPVSITAHSGSTVTVPIHFRRNGFGISGFVFSLDIDPTCLTFASQDQNGDGQPDAVHFALPPQLRGSVSYSATDSTGELDVVVADYAPPLATLPDTDSIIAVSFTAACTPPTEGEIISLINFSQQPPAGFSDTRGNAIVGLVSGGSVRIGGPRPPATPTPSVTPTPPPTITTTPTATLTPTVTVTPPPTGDTDSDHDGVSDQTELLNGTNPLDADSDDDGVNDMVDAFPLDRREAQDNDDDGMGDNADPDDDNDGLADQVEPDKGTDPLDPDTDDDGVLDGLDRFPLDPREAVDADNDGLGDNADPDDDNDQLPDNEEQTIGSNPLNSDSDNDGVVDGTDLYPLDPSRFIGTTAIGSTICLGANLQLSQPVQPPTSAGQFDLVIIPGAAPPNLSLTGVTRCVAYSDAQAVTALTNALLVQGCPSNTTCNAVWRGTFHADGTHQIEVIYLIPDQVKVFFPIMQNYCFFNLYGC